MYVGVVLIPHEYVFPILNSYVCRIRHIIPKWNTLFEKGCVSVAAHNHHQGDAPDQKDDENVSYFVTF